MPKIKEMSRKSRMKFMLGQNAQITERVSNISGSPFLPPSQLSFVIAIGPIYLEARWKGSLRNTVCRGQAPVTQIAAGHGQKIYLSTNKPNEHHGNRHRGSHTIHSTPPEPSAVTFMQHI